MMRQKNVRIATLITLLTHGLLTASAVADNRSFGLSPPSPIDTLFGADFCEEFISFTDNEFLVTTQNRIFSNTFSDFEIETASSRLHINVDPASGASAGLPGGRNVVNVESGSYLLSGSSSVLGIPFNQDILRGRVIGITSDTLGIQLYVLVDIDYAHSNLTAVTGPIGSLTYRLIQDLWAETAPWQDDLLLDPASCFDSSPDLILYADKPDAPDPVVFQITGQVELVDSECVFEDLGGAPIEIQVNFEGNSVDMNPDPARGRYLSCDDTYGSRSGAVIRVGSLVQRSSCVEIEVANDIEGDSDVPIDTLTIELAGTGDATGFVARLENQQGMAFSDDSLPTQPVMLGSGPDQFGPQEGGAVSVLFNDSCRLVASIQSLARVGDADVDTIADSSDNCINKYNPRQRDSDRDGYGNACDPDFNNDGVVNILDLGALRTAFFATGNLYTDLNSDGTVNAVDLDIMREFFFGPPGPSGLRP